MTSISALSLLIAFTADPAADVDYLRDVKPVLTARCYSCHGALKSESSLRLDTVAAMIAGGDGGPVVVPGDASASSIVQRVSDSDEASRMPPATDAGPMTADEIAKLSAWIDAGAPAPENDEPEPDPRDHWAFQPPVRPAMPTVENAEWCHNSIDDFVSATRESHGLTPAPAATPSILLRRLYIDLVGMPPTLAELADFEADPSEEHYLRIVDALLDDPRYAERWGRHWMDVWRYSDWWGLGAEVRNSQKHIWHWRDWIVESLQDDVGYDEMLRQMLAADELYPDDPDRLRATGYLVRNYFKFNRDTWLDDTVEHTSKAFLGLTFNCCRCHDHKYDPMTAENYYSLRAFFEPYQVRTDLVAGYTGVESDGIPRIFDCHLEAPTYLYVRGNAKEPVTDDPLSPGVPEFLSFAPLVIESVDLPPVAHQPGLQPWVVEAYLEEARQAMTEAAAQVEQARIAVEEARQREAALPSVATDVGTPTEPGDETATDWLIQESFDALNPDVWEALSGEWVAVDGQLEQRDTISERSELRLQLDPPADFEAVFRFVIQGGSMWRSVGIVFDTTEGSDILAYVSAYAGGQKVQLAPSRNGNYEYPSNAAQPLQLGLDENVELRVRVRGELINVDVNGQPLLAWRSTIGRHAGSLKLITFDAQAAFDQFDLRPLPADAVLRQASGDPEAPPTLAVADARLQLAERQHRVTELKLESIERRAAADRVRWLEPSNDGIEDVLHEAVRAERAVAAAEAEVKVAEITLERVTQAQLVTDDQLTEIDERLTAAKDAATQAHAAVDEAGTEYTSLRGAFKTVESPTETTESLMAPFPATSTGRRSALADWITDDRNPLTARVAVNHIWSRHFGAPLVPTSFDFGRKGQPPSHPELLDWLSVEFMKSGWSQKHLHRLMVTSATYRMSSSSLGGDANAAIDSENRFLWRMNPTRMEAQVVRDTLLHLSGRLDLTLGGPSIPLDQADSSTRRSLYLVHSHNDHDRFLSMFDDAAVQECYRREESIVPQQALALSNSSQAIEASQLIATGLSQQIAADDDASFVRAAFRLLLADEPSEEELAASLAAIERWRALNDSTETSAARTRELLILALINHNDFVTVR